MTEQQMPTMEPSMPTMEPSASLEQSVEVQEPVIIDDGVSQASSVIETPIDVRKGITVKALRNGFFGQRRIVKGEEFTVPSFESLGEWMMCKESSLQEKHEEAMKKKKAIK